MTRYQAFIYRGGFYVYDHYEEKALTSQRFSAYNKVTRLVDQMNEWEHSEKDS